LAGTVTVAIGGTVPVKFSSHLASANYAISLTLADAQDFRGFVEYSDKTANGFTIHLISSAGAVMGNLKVDWIVVTYK
jgi:hypothetical protein